MKKLFFFFLLFLIASMTVVTIPHNVNAESQLDILVRITENTKQHIKTDMNKIGNISNEIQQLYDKGLKEIDLLTDAAKNEDAVSAKQHFHAAMTTFKKIRIAISGLESETVPLQPSIIQSQTIKKYEWNIKKLKDVSLKLNTNINFESIDGLMNLAKKNLTAGNVGQTQQTLDKIADKGRKIQKLLYDISQEGKFDRAKQFVIEYTKNVNKLIETAKKMGLSDTVGKLENSKTIIIHANTTNQIVNQHKIIIILKYKIEQVNYLQQAKLLQLKSILTGFENKAKILADQVTEDNAAKYFLKNIFYLIDEAKKDLKNSPESVYEKITTIKNLLIKTEKLINNSS